MVLKSLESFANHNGAILAGGTALALQIGHRISYDLDFFTPKHFKTEDILKFIKKTGFRFQILSESTDTFIAEINGVKFSVFTYEYPFIEKTFKTGEIQLANILDIAAMKLIAVAQRGARRDFVDLFFILQEIPFHKIVNVTLQKFGHERINPLHIGKALVYFNDADSDPEPRYIKDKEVHWVIIKKYFSSHIKQLVYDLSATRPAGSLD